MRLAGELGALIASPSDSSTSDSGSGPILVSSADDSPALMGREHPSIVDVEDMLTYYDGILLPSRQVSYPFRVGMLPNTSRIPLYNRIQYRHSSKTYEFNPNISTHTDGVLSSLRIGSLAPWKKLIHHLLSWEDETRWAATLTAMLRDAGIMCTAASVSKLLDAIIQDNFQGTFAVSLAQAQPSFGFEVNLFNPN